MRLRLLIDAEVADATIPVLADLLSEQPRADVTVTAEDGTEERFTGRFMGASEVHGGVL